jgi:ABC-type transporter Mla MlaB component
LTITRELMPVLDLGSSLTIAEAACLQKIMLNLFESVSVMSLNGSDIEQVDGAGIQLLAAFMKEAAERQIEVRWSGVSDRLWSAATQLGLADLLGLVGAD